MIRSFSHKVNFKSWTDSLLDHNFWFTRFSLLFHMHVVVAILDHKESHFWVDSSVCSLMGGWWVSTSCHVNSVCTDFGFPQTETELGLYGSLWLQLEKVLHQSCWLLPQDSRSSLLVFEGVNGEFSELLLQDSKSSLLVFKGDNGEFSCGGRKLDKRISQGGQAVCSSGVRSSRCLQDRGRLVSWMKQSLRVADLSSTSTPTPGPQPFFFFFFLNFF